MTKRQGIALIIASWFAAALLAATAFHFIRIYLLPPAPVVYEIRYVVCRVYEFKHGVPDCETIRTLKE